MFSTEQKHNKININLEFKVARNLCTHSGLDSICHFFIGTVWDFFGKVRVSSFGKCEYL